MKATDYGALSNQFAIDRADRQRQVWRLGYESLLGHPAMPAKGRALDFGCGPGQLTQELAARGLDVTGLDTSEEMIEQACLLPRGTYLHYDGLLAEAVEGEFDLICATFSLCVIPTSELRYVLRDMRRLLAPGGALLILEPNQEGAHGVDYGDLHYHRKEGGVRSGDRVEVTLGSGSEAMLVTDDIYRTHQDYRNLLDRAGFAQIAVTEPRPGTDWGPAWDLQLKSPPFILISAR